MSKHDSPHGTLIVCTKNVIIETNLVQGYDPCWKHIFIPQLSCVQLQEYLRKITLLLQITCCTASLVSMSEPPPAPAISVLQLAELNII